MTFIRPFPGVIRIEPAAACNLSCSHCPTGTVDMARGVMTADTFQRILAQLAPHQSQIRVIVLYHGGEPLLNKRFPEMIRAVKALGIPFVKTLSNGMRLDEAASRSLIESGLDTLQVSVDGTSPEENNLVRRQSDYATILENIKTFLRVRGNRSKPRLDLYNTQFIPADALRVPPDPPPPAYVVRDLGELYPGVSFVGCTWAMRWPHMNVLEDRYEVWSDPLDTEDKNACDHVDSTVTIRWDGTVVPCCYDLTGQLPMGNILNDDLAEIWNNAGYQRLREQIATKDFPELCSNCNVVRPAMYLRHRA